MTKRKNWKLNLSIFLCCGICVTVYLINPEVFLMPAFILLQYFVYGYYNMAHESIQYFKLYFGTTEFMNYFNTILNDFRVIRTLHLIPIEEILLLIIASNPLACIFKLLKI